VSSKPHGDEETAELAKTAEQTWLSELGVLRGSFRLGQARRPALHRSRKRASW
jgi:hypothetical protein